MEQNINYMQFAIVPLIYLRDMDLNSTDKLVMGMICSLTKKKNKCTASNTFLSSQIQVSKRTISKSLTKLKNQNLITIKIVNYQREIYLNIMNNSSMGIEEEFQPP